MQSHQNPPDAHGSATAWRWIALFAIVANVAFNYLYARLGIGPDVRIVSDRYGNLFTPAPYAFAIWGVIYTAFLVYAVSSLRPSQRGVVAYDRIAPWLAVANGLAALWIVVFTHDLVWLSIAVLAVTLGVAATMYARAQRARAAAHLLWIRVPFALFLGWILVATLANVSAGLVAAGVTVGPLLACLLTVIAAAVALSIGIPAHDPIVPGVVAWATFAIATASRPISDAVAGVALAAALTCAIASVAIAVTRYWLPATSHRVT